MNCHTDDRRVARFDVFPDLPGSLNVVTLIPGAICAWHMHKHQTDLYYVAKGLLKVGLAFTDALPRFIVLKEGDPVFEVPVGVWHGYACVGNEPTIVVQYLNRKYDASDEFRKPSGTEWERVNR
jgi:dTDP-4-dehydrorhamnose 3,5-epimerase